MQSRGSTRGDVPPVNGDRRPRHNPTRHALVAWIIWLAFCATVGMLYFVGWRVMQPQEGGGSMSQTAFIAVATTNGLIALVFRAFRARQHLHSRKFVLLVLGLAFGESVALAGLMLRLTHGESAHAVWFVIAAALLQLLQAPVDFTAPAVNPTDAPSGVTVE